MYSSEWRGVNGADRWLAALFSLTLACATPAEAQPQDLRCDTRLQALFTPPSAQAGRYEACISARPLAEVAPHGWPVRQQPALEALGSAGAYNRARVARLYGGRLALVARGLIEAEGRTESRVYISPYPDAELRRLVPGTLIIRFIICCT